MHRSLGSYRPPLDSEVGRGRHHAPIHGFPLLSTADEVAELLRTTRTAVYALIARGQMFGVTRLGRRVLIRTEVLLDWLDQNRAPSPTKE